MRSRLADLCPLEPRDLDAIDRAVGRAEARPAGSEFCAEGEPVHAPYTVLSGWLMRTRTLPDGRRQVLGILLPGDTIHFCWYPEAIAPADIEYCTAARVAEIGELKRQAQAAELDSRVSLAFRLLQAADEAKALMQVCILGRQSAYERVALLMLDLHRRLATVGLARDGAFNMPLTQQVLADTLGLSIVHVNRTLMQLGRDKHLSRRGKSVAIMDVDRLAGLVDYQPPRMVEPFRQRRGDGGGRFPAPKDHPDPVGC